MVSALGNRAKRSGMVLRMPSGVRDPAAADCAYISCMLWCVCICVYDHVCCGVCICVYVHVCVCLCLSVRACEYAII